MIVKNHLILLQMYVAKSLQNCDGLRYPFNLDKINKMIKELIKEIDEPK